MASRACESILLAAGLSELIAPDPDAFVQQSVRFASREPDLAALRKRLEVDRHHAALFDTVTRVRELEQAFLQMRERAMRG
jgi:predicted O-linked N-acetylglucosamine transferase (SPINDLY family)